MDTVRIATLQYFIRPVKSFDEFRAQVRGLVETASDYRCRVIVFPEYFTLQLLTLGDVRRPMVEQVRELAAEGGRVVELLATFARELDIYIIGGTIPVLDPHTSHLLNVCHVFSPGGQMGTQPKIHMTRFEREEWDVFSKRELNTFETDFGRIGVAICYDVEFPEIAREHARAGAQILFVPSCTDDRQGFMRVRYCAHARAIENQIYVVQSSTVGSLPMVPAVSLNYGQAAILTPSDFAFSRDGIAAEGIANQEAMIIADVNLSALSASRAMGTVLPLIDAERSPEIVRAQLHPLVSDPSMRVIVRQTRPADFDGIISLCRRVYQGAGPWKEEQLRSHVDLFPDGQLVAVDPETGAIVGMAASLVLFWDDYDITDSWKDFTDGGYFRNHDPKRGRTLYGAEVMVDPEWRGQGVGKLMYDARTELVKRLRLLRIRAGARLRGFHRYSQEMSAPQYVEKVCRGEVSDPTLTFQLKGGFRVLGVVENYLASDPESLGHAAIIEWLNPDVATAQDYAAQPERFRIKE